MDQPSYKNRFGIIGSSPALVHALDVAIQVANTDLSVLINGESGVGKEVFLISFIRFRQENIIPLSQLTVALSRRARSILNCLGMRKVLSPVQWIVVKGISKRSMGGTIFLDEIGEMPLGTQARLLRVLEAGEYIRVGSSKVQKTDVRVIAASNKDLLEFTHAGRFREDLYYRLNTVPIRVPALRDRKEDIPLLFRKFAVDFADRYKSPPVQLEDEARNV